MIKIIGKILSILLHVILLPLVIIIWLLIVLNPKFK